jgi:hypothetical protein
MQFASLLLVGPVIILHLVVKFTSTGRINLLKPTDYVVHQQV